ALVRPLRRPAPAAPLPRPPPEGSRDRRNRLVPRRRGRRLAVAARRHEQPVRRIDRGETIASRVAEPPAIDVDVEARLEPRDPAPLVVVRSPPVHVDLDVAAPGAAGAHALGAVEVHPPPLEAEGT